MTNGRMAQLLRHAIRLSLGSAPHLRWPASAIPAHVDGRSGWGVLPMGFRSQSSDALDTPADKEFQMASSGPADSSAHRRKPAVRMLVVLSVVIAIVLLVVLL